jgi:hypothetical protein
MQNACELREVHTKFWWEKQINLVVHESNIEIDLKELGWESLDWIHLAQDND